MRTDIASARVFLVRSPLKRPFITAQGRRTETVNAALELRLKGGARGYGEASTSIAQKHLTAGALSRALTRLAAGAKGEDVRGWRALVDAAWSSHGELSPAVAAFEAALVSALAGEAGTTLAGYFGGASASLETDVTISASTDGDSTREAAAEAARGGFRILKVKVGGRREDDLARVRAVRAAAPRAALILDGNQGFTAAGALSFYETVVKEGGKVVLLEQPTPKADLKALAFVSKRCPVPVAADESVQTPADAARAADAGVTAVNVKLAKSGISRGLEIAAVARAAGLPLMIGCMAETPRGLAASVHLALGTGFFEWRDLDSDLLLRTTAAERKAAGWVRNGRFASLA